MYVLSAVRTPIGLLNGSLCEFSAGQLSAIVFREALERAIVPVEDIEHLFVGCTLNSDFDKEIIKRITLPNSTKIFTSKCSLECFVKACQFIQKYNQKVCLAGGVESMSNNISYKKENSLEAALKSLSKNNLEQIFCNRISNQPMPNQSITQPQSYNAFCDELLKINFRKKGSQIFITEDEQIKNYDLSQKIESNLKDLVFPGDGAAAVIVANEGYIKKNQLTPLAKVKSFVSQSASADECFSVMCQTIRKALDNVGFNSQNISMWEINTLDHTILSSIINELSINPSLINKDKDIFNVGLPFGMYGGKMISHIIHSLSPEEFGCAASLSIDGIASAVIFKKQCTKTSVKPQLTLYTKKSCLLCDDLEKQLEPYKNHFSLQKIDIELNENKKFRNLYRYEIPVLFLDGTFLCKHKLDSEYFHRRLQKLEGIH